MHEPQSDTLKGAHIATQELPTLAHEPQSDTLKYMQDLLKSKKKKKTDVIEIKNSLLDVTFTGRYGISCQNRLKIPDFDKDVLTIMNRFQHNTSYECICTNSEDPSTEIKQLISQPYTEKHHPCTSLDTTETEM